MRVSLLCPPVSAAGPVQRPRHWPLYALCTAAALREHGHQVRIFDAHLHPPEPARAAAEASRDADAVVLFSADYNRRIPVESQRAHLQALSSAAPQLPVVLAARNSPAEAARLRAALPEATAVTVGEPEAATLAALSGDDPAPGVLREVGQDAVPAGPEATPDAPAWDLLHPRRYGFSPHQTRGEAVFPVLASRGCPYGCFFCEVRSQAAYQGRPARDVVREIRLLQQRFGASSFFLADPMFGLGRGPTAELLAQLAPLGVRWSAMTRTDRVDAALLRQMRDAGCWSVLFGVETLNPAAQQAAAKRLDPATVAPAIRAARSAGLEVIVSAMVGLPGDTPAGVRATLDGLIAAEPDFAQFFEVRVPVEHAVEGGTLDPSPSPAWEFDGQAYVGDGFSGPGEVGALRREAYRRFYLRPGYVLGRLRAVRARPRAELRRGVAGARIAWSRAVGWSAP